MRKTKKENLYLYSVIFQVVEIKSEKLERKRATEYS